MRYLVVPLQLHFRYEKRFPRDIRDMQGNKYGRLKEYTMAQSLNNVYFKSVCTVNVSERMKSLSLLVLQTIFKIYPNKPITDYYDGYEQPHQIEGLLVFNFTIQEHIC